MTKLYNKLIELSNVEDQFDRICFSRWQAETLRRDFYKAGFVLLLIILIIAWSCLLCFKVIDWTSLESIKILMQSKKYLQIAIHPLIISVLATAGVFCPLIINLIRWVNENKTIASYTNDIHKIMSPFKDFPNSIYEKSSGKMSSPP
jgi:hypothetical protein